MRISISGTQNTGKSTLVKAFLQKWPMYGTPAKSYRDIIKENNLDHSSNTNEESQLLILDWMLKTQDTFANEKNVIYDRCPWDNLAYTLVANSYDTISDEVTAASISLVRESMKKLDIIFWIPFDEDITVVEDGLRDTSETHIKEVDNVFRQLFDHYQNELENDIFYPKEDCPAIIEVVGKTVDDRLFYISQFVDELGGLIEPDPNFFSDENLTILENMLKDQKIAGDDDKKMEKLLKEIKANDKR